MRPSSHPRAAQFPIRPPLILIAGGADGEGPASLESARAVLRTALAGRSATLISGGTDSGIPGLVGELAAAMPRLTAIGYLPRQLPPGARRDRRYSHFRTTPARRFSAAESLQTWADLLAAGIDPTDVTLLGWGGGQIAAREYRVALLLGARVGLVEASGRSADALLRDSWWSAQPGLRRLPADGRAIRAFLFSRRKGKKVSP